MVLLQKSKKLRSTVDLLKKGNDDIINAIYDLRNKNCSIPVAIPIYFEPIAISKIKKLYRGI